MTLIKKTAFIDNSFFWRILWHEGMLMNKVLRVLLSTALCTVVLSAVAYGQTSNSNPKTGLIPTPEQLQKSFRSSRVTPREDPIPQKKDLSSLFPVPGAQGNLNSCTAWATAYACKSFQENLENGWGVGTKDKVFSPSYVYNQINRGRDNGSTIEDAMSLIQSQGCATLSTMPYTDNYLQAPTESAHNEARQFKAQSFSKVDYKNTDAMKSVIADNNAVVIGLKVYENFMTYKGGIYRIAQGDFLGSHAMCVVGYDDEKQAYKLMNSWGTDWGEKGFVWIDYGLFKELNQTALVMYDEKANDPSETYPPAGVSASEGSYANRIQVSWPEVKNALYYIVYRKDAGRKGGFAEVGKTKGTVFLDENVKPSSSYYYAVKSVGIGGQSGFSEAAKGSTKSSVQELGIPKNLRGKLEKGSVRLRWDEVAGIEGYYVYRWDPKAEQYTRLGISRDIGYEDASIAKEPHTERYIVTAFAGNSESKASEALSVTIEAKPDVLVETPQNIQVSKGSYRDIISISWNAVRNAEQYFVLRWNDSKNDWDIIGKTTSTTYQDKDVKKGYGYYTVVAVWKQVQSRPASFSVGYVAGYKYTDASEKVQFADKAYYDFFRIDEETFFSDDRFFRNDRKATGKSVFFDNFDEGDFFFNDEEAFFYVDEKKFFGEPEKNFFDSGEDFFKD